MTSPTKRALIAVLVLSAVAGGVLTWSRWPSKSHTQPAPSSSPLASCPSCNVLLVTIDTVRADYLECFGAQAPTMPNLCALAQRGLLFEHAVSPAPTTLPALTGLMTGGVLSNERLAERLSFYEQASYAAEELRLAGYTTAAIVDHPALGTLETPGRQSGFLHRGFSQFVNHGVLGAADKGGEVSTSAESFLEGHARDKFFLWLHYFGPHFPYAPSQEDARRYGFDEARCGRIGKIATIEELRRLTDTITDNELECVRNLYRAELYRTDAWLGEVLESLTTLGLWDTTLVVVTADHGEEFKERGRFGHERTVFEELVHVPLIVVPSRDRVARRIAEPVSTLSVFDWVTGVNGESPLRIDREVLTRTHHDYMDKTSHKMRSEPNSFALYEEGLKAVIPRPGEPAVLYDLSVDPQEARPLPPAAPAARELARRLERFVSAPEPVSVPEDRSLRDLLRLDFQRLENLGYFE